MAMMLWMCLSAALTGASALSLSPEQQVLRGSATKPGVDAAAILHFAQLRGVGEQPEMESLEEIFDFRARSLTGDDDEEEVVEMDEPTGNSSTAVSPLAPPTAKENPKCDAACTNGTPEQREDCMFSCARMQKEICHKGFTCRKGCGNHVKQLEKDHECQSLCESVHAAICYPFKYEAPADLVSPHHDDKVPPSIEATPAPRIFKGLTLFCNLYPVSSNFEIIVMATPADKDGAPVASLGYKQCDEIELKTGDVIGLRSGGAMAGISKPIFKIPTMMLFGQWAHGNHQVNFNRYFAKSDGAYVCNGFPIWEKDDINVGQELQLYRGGYGKAAIARLRYKECTPTSLHDNDVLATTVKGKEAGMYTLSGKPRVIVLGKAGETTSLAYEAWSSKEFGKFKK